jgi:hypothetical protein
VKTELFLVACLAAALGSVAACNPHLVAESPAPPGRTARLDEVRGFWGVKSYKLEISQGTALAITCSKLGPCKNMTLAVDNGGVAEARPASLDVLRPNGYSGNQATATAMVVVGKTAGTTRLHVRTKDGNRDVAVTVIPQPAAAADTRASAKE